MRFIEDPLLNRLSVLLRSFDAGDRILTGCIELFTTEEKIPEENIIGEKFNHDLGESSPGWWSKSTLGPLKKEEAKELLTNMLSAMNQCFPDYDFSGLSVDHFSRQQNFAEIYNNINYHLSFFVERYLPGFLQDLWTAIRATVNLDETDIYSCSDPFSDEDGLFSFDYFFFDRKQQKILFFSCVTKSKYNTCPDGAPGSPCVDSSEEEEDTDYWTNDDTEEADDGNDDDDDTERQLSDGLLSDSASQKVPSDDDDGGLRVEPLAVSPPVDSRGRVEPPRKRLRRNNIDEDVTIECNNSTG